MDTDDLTYCPPKPLLEQAATATKSKKKISLWSLFFFIGAAYLFFGWSLEYILILTVVVFIHELGHYTAMRLFNYRDLSIFFIPLLGAATSGKKESVSRKQEAIVLLAGPVPGILIGCILYEFSDIYPLLGKCADMFIFLNIINLLPVIPLDGGQLLKVLFFASKDVIQTIFILISVAVISVYALNAGSYILLIFAFFLLMQLTATFRIYKIRKVLEKKGINLNQTYETLPDRDYWLIRDEIGQQWQEYSQVIRPHQYEVSIEEGRIIGQVKTILRRSTQDDLKIGTKIALLSCWLLAFIIPFISTIISILFKN